MFWDAETLWLDGVENRFFDPEEENARCGNICLVPVASSHVIDGLDIVGAAAPLCDIVVVSNAKRARKKAVVQVNPHFRLDIATRCV